MPLVALLALLLAPALFESGDDSPPAFLDRATGREPTPTPTPTPLPPPQVTLHVEGAAHQGYAARLSGRVTSPAGGALAATLSFGDGTSAPLVLRADGTFSASHAYAASGNHTVVVSAEGPTGSATQALVLDVVPRKLLFIQGMNSESRCPEGEHFLDRAPAWVAEELPAATAAGGLSIDAADYVYFSYSGSYCDGPGGTPVPDYRKDETCRGIDETSAPRLRELIESLAPARVTIVAHSMGGLVAAYLAGDDPQWAQQHIASVVTFDSPLSGIDGMRAEVLGLYRINQDGCGRSSAAMDDLRAGSSVTQTASLAGRVVPFFTLDGAADERGALSVAQAVPSGRTSIPGARAHLQVPEEHSEIWNRSRGSLRLKSAFVACAIVVNVTRCPAQ